jgi:hypothetical protein
LDLDCREISCKTDCPSHFRNIRPSNPQLSHLQHSTKDFINRQQCCSLFCRENCTLSDGTDLEDEHYYKNPENPCETFFCRNGQISIHVPSCRPLPCARSHHVTRIGDCCPSCHETWSNFCKNDPDEDECDIACQFGFVRNEARDCDECRCKKLQTTTLSPTTTTPNPTQTESTPSDDVTESVEYNRYLYPEQNIFIFISVALSVALIACIVGISVFFHNKVYKRIPSVLSA